MRCSDCDQPYLITVAGAAAANPLSPQRDAPVGDPGGNSAPDRGGIFNIAVLGED